MAEVLRASLLSEFSCLGPLCPDTCCQNWSMQVDATTFTLYRESAPELLEAVESSANADPIMRKDAYTGFCVKFADGLCAIHRDYGDQFLGDACHFYPRITRRLNDTVLMTAALSCPEITRLALLDRIWAQPETAHVDRLPHQLKEYLPEGLTTEQALAIHQSFLHATEGADATPRTIFLRILSASHSLARLPMANWPVMAEFYLTHADTRIPPAEAQPNDPFNLLHALCGLIVASHKVPSPRLMLTLSEIQRALAASLDWKTVRIETSAESWPAYLAMAARWREHAELYAPVLKRWLVMQLSMALYPFGGLGHTLHERITLIGVRLATLQLALAAGLHVHEGNLPEDAMLRIVQSLSRFLDHLGDAGYSLKIYQETGWTREARMGGLLAI